MSGDPLDAQGIPMGDHCYATEPLTGAPLPEGDPDQRGKYVRVWQISDRFKLVLCPHWRRDDHGWVQCQLTGKAEVHEGASGPLADMRKVCELGLDTEPGVVDDILTWQEARPVHGS